MNSKGFFLFELMIYSFLTIMIGLLTITMSLKIIQTTRNVSTMVRTHRLPYALLLVLARDIESASFHVADWSSDVLRFKKKSVNAHQESFQTWSEWSVKNKRLVHKEGNFDPQTQTWKEARATTVLYGVHSFSWKMHLHSTFSGTIVGVTLVLETVQGSLEKHIVLKNYRIV